MHIQEINLLPPQQFGFRTQHNTVQPLARIHRLVKENYSENKSTGMILLDVKAAFDSVWHEGLIHKMMKARFHCSLTKIIKSFLTNRSFQVHIEDKQSNIFNLPAGCPQGSVLSPILYNIYTHEFPELPSATSSIFADDTAIISSRILASEIINNLQTSIEIVTSYFNKWKIKLNSSKTQAIFFTRKRRAVFTPQTQIRMENVDIPWELNVKYLGVILDSKMTFKAHISYTVDKHNKLVKLLYPFINRKSSMSLENKMIIVKVIFHAVMFYAAAVWSKTAKCHQNKLLKIIHDLPWYFSTAELHNITGIELITDKIERLTNNFIDKCLNSTITHINSLSVYYLL